MDSHLRSILKSISWRVIAAFILTAIAWGVTGDFAIGATIGAIDIIIKLGIYYLHERIWLKINLDGVEEFINWFERED